MDIPANVEGMSQEQKDALLKGLLSVLETKEGKRNFAKIVTNPVYRGEPTRKGWPYYKERFAVPLIQILLQMKEDGKARIFPYVRYVRYTRHSLHARLYQSIRYIQDCHSDPALKEYARTLGVFKRASGIEISQKSGESNEMPCDIFNESIEEQSFDQLVSKITEFLNTAKPGEVLRVDRLHLTSIEVDEIKLMLDAASNQFMGRICAEYIKIVRPDEDLMKKLETLTHDTSS